MLKILIAAMFTAAAVAAEPAEKSAVTEQPAPFSTWLDFNVLARPDAPMPSLPIWFESFQSDTIPATDTTPPQTIFRLRVRRMPGLHRELLLRVFFDDIPDMQPVVATWTETGRQKNRVGPLGDGIGISTSESLVVPLEDVDYIDIEVPGNGSNLRGAFASSLKTVEVLQSLDFDSGNVLEDPFGKWLGKAVKDDTRLFGRIRAPVDDAIVKLDRRAAAEMTWSFELAQQPLAAVVSFDVLNADLTAPPMVSVNGSVPAAASVHWPDLADPGFRAESRALEAGMRFQYTGWLRAQVTVPGFQMLGGLNKVTVSLSDGSGPVAVRNIELQLKQNWKHFDYKLTPVHP